MTSFFWKKVIFLVLGSLGKWALTTKWSIGSLGAKWMLGGTWPIKILHKKNSMKIIELKLNSELTLSPVNVDIVDDKQIANLLLSTSGALFHLSKFLLILVLVDYHFNGLDLQNKILWCFENGLNWFMSSFILSSKNEIVNMIFQIK